MAVMSWPRRRWAIVTLFLAAGLCLGIAAGLWLGSARGGANDLPGPVDIGFAQDMSVHHGQALMMSQWALDRAADPRVAMYARQILVSQADEQGTLRGWLTLWNAPQLPSGPAMAWMGHPGPMPGMATQSQLDRLAVLHGDAFDHEFLTLMTRHHLGGIHMAQFASTRARLPVVRSLAALMIKEQEQEVVGFAALTKAT